jgi:ABC transporter substrate binding protein (PQQ-dependent alcohol dehydrogenase system)
MIATIRRGGTALCAAAAALLAAPATAQDVKLTLETAVVRVDTGPALPLSRLDLPPEDDGFAGAERATADNATTGRFLGHAYETRMVETVPEEAVAEIEALAADGVRHFVTLAPADTLLAIADRLVEVAPEAVVVNATARDDRLRNGDCRANVFHVAPSRAMLADGLAQYLVWKKWTDWVIVHGSNPADIAMGEAYARAARKFGVEVEETLVFEDTGRARRSDSGHVLVQRQVPVFMQEADDHDVVVVADESEYFGAYIPYRTWEPRPVAGDAGLEALTWHPAHEAWGATQLQRRFERDQDRRMTERDYQAWMALRALGEAVTRTDSADPEAVADYLRSDAFELAAFKGQALTFRPWNQQLRQGILLADGKLVVSVSPQEEFLHETTRLDTLGYDEPESACSLN